MALRKRERRNYGGKSPVSIKYKDLHSFKEGLILLRQSILETRRISHLHGSVHFTIPLKIVLINRYTINRYLLGKLSQYGIGINGWIIMQLF